MEHTQLFLYRKFSKGVTFCATETATELFRYDTKIPLDVVYGTGVQEPQKRQERALHNMGNSFRRHKCAKSTKHSLIQEDAGNTRA